LFAEGALHAATVHAVAALLTPSVLLFKTVGECMDSFALENIYLFIYFIFN